MYHAPSHYRLLSHTIMSMRDKIVIDFGNLKFQEGLEERGERECSKSRSSVIFVYGNL